MEDSKLGLAVVIPAYEPDEKLISLIKDLNSNFKDFLIVIVNDGTKKEESIKVFNVVKNLPNTHLISYDENRGKGFALKTAFEYIKEQEGKYVIITADSDGQHHPHDIERVYNYYLKVRDGIILGSREFEGEVPLKSRFGNIVSTNLTRLIFSEKFVDTQTGLRAFSSDLIDFMLQVKGNRFEYEMNMLSEAIRFSIPIHEIGIKTIYFNENKGTHFRPVRDFFRITSCQIKYLLPIIICYIINMAAFETMKIFIYKNISDLDNIYLMYTCLVSGFITMLAGLLIDGLGIFYGNPYVLRRRDLILNYIVRFIIVIVCDTLLTLLFAKLFGYNQRLIAVSKFLSVITVALITLLINFIFAHKSKLYKGDLE